MTNSSRKQHLTKKTTQNSRNKHGSSSRSRRRLVSFATHRTRQFENYRTTVSYIFRTDGGRRRDRNYFPQRWSLPRNSFPRAFYRCPKSRAGRRGMRGAPCAPGSGEWSGTLKYTDDLIRAGLSSEVLREEDSVVSARGGLYVLKCSLREIWGVARVLFEVFYEVWGD